MTKPGESGAGASLDLSDEEMLAAAGEICRILGEQRSQRATAPVMDATASSPPAPCAPLPRKATPIAELLEELRRSLLPSCRRNDSPRFFGYVCSGGSDVGTLADFLASGLNQNVTAWRSAPSATGMERLVIDWLRTITGMPEGSEGLLLGGGSPATLTALAIARDAGAGADIAAGGLLTLGREMTLYASDQVHMSVPRAASLLGLGREAVRLIPARADFTMDLEALGRAIGEDRRAGRIPFCVVASAGTTATGAVDPLAEIAGLCRREGLWMHVDAAYGGFAALAPSAAPLLAGLGDADSVSIDPHKWLHVPFDCGALIVRDPGAMQAPFSEVGAYARTRESSGMEAWTFFERGPELSRRFRALKLWMVMRHFGTDRLGEMIESDLLTARYLAGKIQDAADMELLAPVPLSVVCFRITPAGLSESGLDRLNRGVLEALQSEAIVYPTHAEPGGRFAIRACILNPRSGINEMDLLLERTRLHARRLLGSGS
jgi:glutamate/tyrosine decarboxylase-like PLP-dependent enzyme